MQIIWWGHSILKEKEFFWRESWNLSLVLTWPFLGVESNAKANSVWRSFKPGKYYLYIFPKWMRTYNVCPSPIGLASYPPVQLLVLKEKCTCIRSPTPLPEGWEKANMSLCCGQRDGSHTCKAQSQLAHQPLNMAPDGSLLNQARITFMTT